MESNERSMEQSNQASESATAVASAQTERPAYSPQKSKYGQKSLSVACGEVGTASLDLYSKRVTFEMPLIKGEDGVNLSLVYNSDWKDEIQYGTNLGGGWRLSALSCIAGVMNGQTAYEDGAGRQHPLYNRKWHASGVQGTSEFDDVTTRVCRRMISPINGSTRMTDEQYIFSSTGGGEATMKFNENCSAQYDMYSLITQIYDAESGFSATYEYQTLNGVRLLKKITYGNGKMITFDYTTTGRLYLIVNSQENYAITYDANGRLHTVNTYEGTLLLTATYTSGNLTGLESGNGAIVRFTYDDFSYTVEEKSKYSRIQESGVTAGEMLGNSWTVYFYDHRTAVSNRYSVMVEYLFGKNGVLIGEEDITEEPAFPYNITRGKVQTAQTFRHTFQKVGEEDECQSVYSNFHSISANLRDEDIIHRLFTTETLLTAGSEAENIYPVRTLTTDFAANGREGTFVFTCWACATSRTGTVEMEVAEDAANQSTMPWFGVRLSLNGTGETAKKIYVPFNEECTDWQMIAIPIVMREEALNSVRVQVDYRNNTGDLLIQNGTLYYVEGTCSELSGYDYSITTDNKYSTITLYDFYGRPCKKILRKIGSNTNLAEAPITYTASDTVVYYSPMQEKDFTGLLHSYTYDEKRRRIAHRPNLGSLMMINRCTYDDYNRITQSEDERGYATTSTYNAKNSPVRITTPKGNAVVNSYSAQNELTGVATASGTAMDNNAIVYKKGLPVKYTHGTVSYSLAYDGLGRVLSVSGNGMSKTVTYNDTLSPWRTATVTYGNGYSETHSFDKYGKPKIVVGSGTVGTVASYVYDGEEKLTQCIDNAAQMQYNYTYISDDTTISMVSPADKIKEVKKCNSSGTPLFTITPSYGNRGDENGVTYTYGNYTDNYMQMYDNTDRLITETTPLDTVGYVYDSLGRLTRKTVSARAEGYKYHTNPENAMFTTPLVKTVTYHDSAKLNYEYDANGNITQITDENNAIVARYSYDGLDRLIREDNNGYETVTYEYDKRGNIVKTKHYPYTTGTIVESNNTAYHIYSYSGDRLVSRSDYDVVNGTTSSASSTFDESGNPTSYLGTAATWTRGRLLASYYYPAARANLTFTYDKDGIRTKKSAPGYTTTYYTDGGKIIAEVTNGRYKRYFYDASGIAGMEYNGVKYRFRKNLQGDVIAVFDTSGNCLGGYVYDAWGKTLSVGTHAAVTANPFRYRGYYQDYETGLYYLQSRYYDPTVGRFLNADTFSYLEPETLNGLNLYAYALNNPVMYCDPTGHFAVSTFGVGAVVGIVLAAIILGGAFQLISNAFAGETGSDLWRGVAGEALGTGANALALCLSPFTGGASIAFAAGISAGVQTGIDTIETLIRGEQVFLSQIALDLGINFVTVFIGNWLGGITAPTNSGWFKPKRFSSVFTRPYGQKLLLQTGIGVVFSGIVNFARKFDWMVSTLKKSVE